MEELIRRKGGARAKAIQTAKQTGELMTPLRENKLARSALKELIRASRETLTLTAVEEVRRKLEHVRARWPESGHLN